jgi:ribosomal protein S6E (S10)
MIPRDQISVSHTATAEEVERAAHSYIHAPMAETIDGIEVGDVSDASSIREGNAPPGT